MEATVTFEVTVSVRDSRTLEAWWENRGTFNNEIAAETFALALAENKGEQVRVERIVTP